MWERVRIWLDPCTNFFVDLTILQIASRMLVHIFLCWLNDSSDCLINFFVDLTLLQIASWMLVQIFLCWLNDSSYCYLNARTNFYVDLTILQIASWMLEQLDSDGTQGKQCSNVWKCRLVWVISGPKFLTGSFLFVVTPAMI